MKECNLSAFAAVVGQVFRAMGRRVRQHWKNAGIDITLEQWSILAQLWAKDGQCQQELSVCTDRDKPSTTRLIDTMEKHNLVVRVPDQNDRRAKLIYLTRKGKELQKVLLEGIAKAEQDALDSIEPADIETCLHVLQKVYDNVSEE